MPIFSKSLQVNESNPQDAIKKMVNHIKYIQEQLEYTLLNLDSRNINEIDLDSTTITGSTGSTSIGGTYINIVGANGESFTVGTDNSGQFVFGVSDKKGVQKLYLNSSGEIVITKHSLTISGGKW